MKILLVEDERITRITLTDTLILHGHDITPCETGLKALELLKTERFHVVITDLRLPGTNGLEILKAVKAKQNDTEVVIMTAYATVETAVEALKLGAYDYITKPFDPDELLNILAHIEKLHIVLEENIKLKDQIRTLEGTTLIGNSMIMKQVQDTIRMIAPRDCTVLIQGESGTGKELAAREIHRQSERTDAPFVPVNCAAVPAPLFESILFGHEKGSFSGADKRHHGYVERAHRGTLFIDDIDDFPLELQAKLLRTIQEREVERLGASQPVSVDIRIICATKVDLMELVNQQRFREDLYYRLNVVPVILPPLRSRREDIPVLANHFLQKYDADEIVKSRMSEIAPKLLSYHWPGNVRELENVVQRLIALPHLNDLRLVPQIPPGMQHTEPGNGQQAEPDMESDTANASPYRQFARQADIAIIQKALQEAGGNISIAARKLQLPRSTLRSKMFKYGIEPKGS